MAHLFSVKYNRWNEKKAQDLEQPKVFPDADSTELPSKELQTGVWSDPWQGSLHDEVFSDLPPELEERLEHVLAKSGMDRDQFIIHAIVTACKEHELAELREKGKQKEEEALLIQDPDTQTYRCFPAYYFDTEERERFQALLGKYYPIRWKKTNRSWKKVFGGYFEWEDAGDKKYIRIENGEAVGKWEEYPFGFFQHGWTWGIYDQQNVIEVKGRSEEFGALYYDIFVNNEKVDSVLTIQEVVELVERYR